MIAARVEAALSEIVVERTTIQQSSYSGPLPPAEETRRYEEVYPGFTNRWITMAEKAQVAEIATIRRRDRGEFVHRMSCLVAAFLLCGGMIGGGLWMIYAGKNLAGFGTLAAGVGTVLLAGITRSAGSKSPLKTKPRS